MHTSASPLLLALAAALPATALAQDPAACAGLDDSKRLACYDAIFRPAPADPAEFFFFDLGIVKFALATL